MTNIMFSYHIVQSGGGRALVHGQLYTSSVEAAKKHVETVSAHSLAGQSNLEVVLRDTAGTEVWRGRWLGSEH